MIVAREQLQHHYGIPAEEKRESRYPRRERQLSRRSRAVFTGVVALGFITGIIISFYYAQVFITNYRIHSLQKQLVVLQGETDDLYSDLAKLNSLERIEKVAIYELGMVRPDNSKAVKVAVNMDAEKAAGQEKQQGPAAEEGKQQIHPSGQNENWVIQAFTDLVQQVKEGVSLR